MAGQGCRDHMDDTDENILFSHLDPSVFILVVFTCSSIYFFLQ